MIYSDSRYVDADVYKAYDPRKNANFLTVTRPAPTSVSKFIYYQWKEGDRLDLLAAKYTSAPTHWWKIMDINPEVINPFEITVGTYIRIPIV